MLLRVILSLSKDWVYIDLKSIFRHIEFRPFALEFTQGNPEPVEGLLFVFSAPILLSTCSRLTSEDCKARTLV
jgi:hypothetical protein